MRKLPVAARNQDVDLDVAQRAILGLVLFVVEPANTHNCMLVYVPHVPMICNNLSCSISNRAIPFCTHSICDDSKYTIR